MHAPPTPPAGGHPTRHHPAPHAGRAPYTPWAAVGWRALIVGCAVTGLNAAVGRTGGGWETNALLPLSQLASLLTAVAYLGILAADLLAVSRKRPEPPTAWLRGLLAVTLLLVLTVWFTVMEGDVAETWSLFEHLLTPLAVLVDWLAFGRRQATVRWWYPLSWLAPLTLYLVVLVNTPDANPYEFLDPDDSGFTGFVAGALVGVTAGGYALLAVARLRRARGDGRAAPQVAFPQPGFPQPGFPPGPAPGAWPAVPPGVPPNPGPPPQGGVAPPGGFPPRPGLPPQGGHGSQA